MDESQNNKNMNKETKGLLGLSTILTQLNNTSLRSETNKSLDRLFKNTYCRGLLASSEVKNKNQKDSYFLSYAHFMNKWLSAPKVASDKNLSASVVYITVDGVADLRTIYGDAVLELLEVELKEFLSEIKSVGSFLGKIDHCSYILGTVGLDAEIIASVEFFRRRIERKIFTLKNTHTSSKIAAATFYLRVTISAGMASSTAQKTLDPYALLTFAEYAIKKAQTKGINSVQAA